MEYTTDSQDKTSEVGREIAHSLTGGDIILLSGELGAGKTSLTKGIAEGLGVADEILSPTFTLMNVYEVKGKGYRVKGLVHIDTYRLESEQQLIDIGIEDYLGDPETICVIEWPEKLDTLLKGKKTMRIQLEHTENGKRKITVH